jgi:predicted PurR-regulated permease PerM
MLRKIDISHKTIFFITGFVALLWALYQIREVIIILFVAIIFMSALYPIVDYLESKKIPKPLAITFVYIVVIAILATLVAFVVSPLIEQTSHLADTLPRILDQVLPPETFDRSILQQQISGFTDNAFSYGLLILTNIVTFISIAVLTFYLLLERDRLDQLFTQFTPGQRSRVERVIRKIEDKLGAWLRGQIILSLIIAVLAYIALFALGVPYALPLAIVAGLFEVVPVIGPIISSVPAIFIAYLTSPVTALLTAIAFFVIQQAENHVVVPQVMKKAVGLNPLVVILAVAIGGKLLGIVGALLAVPIAVVIEIVSQDLLNPEDLIKE